MATLEGSVTAFFLFDIADAIDLPRVRDLIGPTVTTPLAPRPSTPPYVQYQQPPVSCDGEAVGTPTVGGFRIRLKTFDYGVVSVALTRTVPGTWEELLTEARGWYEDVSLVAGAERACRGVMARVRPALSGTRADFLSEDYFVFSLTRVAGVDTAEALLAQHGVEVAQLLRGEREPLSSQERSEALRNRLSYFANDLVVPTWNGALVYDTELGAQAILEIVEYANSQLLEFRYYDRLLDVELARIYPQLQRSGWRRNWRGLRFTRTAQQVHSLFIDVNELTDKAENALKIAGDVYAARLFAMVAARLGLDQWKGNVREKLKTLDDIYRFEVERTAMARGEFLELTIVILILIELVLPLLGITR
jgi:hypothetical protein